MNSRCLSLGLLAATSLLGGACGSRADYELLYLRQLIAAGNTSEARDLIEGLPPGERAQVDVASLSIGLGLRDLGIPPAGIAGQLNLALAAPAQTYAQLPEASFPTEPLRELLAEVARVRASFEGGPLPGDLDILCGASELLAGLLLTKAGAPDGLAITLDALEPLCSVRSALPGDPRSLALNVMAELDRSSPDGDREAALGRLLAHPKTSKP